MAEPRLSIYNKTEYSGPITKKHKRKAWIQYAIIALIGFLPAILNMSWRWQLIGFGLSVPGGGFLALGGVSGIILFIVGFFLMVLSVYYWQQTGYQAIPMLFWAGLMILPATFFFREPKWPAASVWLVLGVILFYFIVTRIHNHNLQQRELKTQRERLEYFKEEIPAEEAMAEPEAADGDLELTETQLRQQKYIFDLAFGPFGEFQGFTKPNGSQIYLTALRYQINSMMNAIQQIQCQYTPNFHGYASQAQRRFIDLYRLPKIWSYWKTENILGNFNFDGNPIAKDNVMMTGFFLLNVTMYMRNTGDMRYTEPGSLTFKSDKAVYPHDVHTIADAIVWNWDNRDYVVYPCEPNFIYALCNWKAMQSMINYEKIFHNGKWLNNADRVYNAFVSEMTSPSGNSIILKSSRTGVGFKLPNSNTEAYMIPMYNTEDPVLARQTYAFFRKDCFERDEKGTLIYKATRHDHGDNTDNYCDSVSLGLFPAKEMGDKEAQKAILDVLENQCERIETDGAIHFRCSTEANALMLQASINTRNGWHRAVVDGPAECTKGAPLLSSAPYPDVMVAKAFSHGKDLELVLYPFDKNGCESDLGLSRLVPGGAYVVSETGERFTANDAGEATLTVKLAGRTAVTVQPA